MVLNSSLGTPCVDLADFGHCADSSLALRPKSAKNSTTSTANTRICDLDSANQAKSAESTLDSAESQNLGENNSVRSTQTRPLRGAKNRIQGCSSATADFLLEAEKRGSPPKSEKAELLARRGSGAGGAALLRKEKDSNEIAESVRDSQSGLPREQSSLAMTENRDFAESSLDSALSTHEANSAIADEFLGLCEASDKDRTQVHRGSEPKRSLKSRCESKFALDSTLLQNRFFPAKNTSRFAESRAKFLPNTALIALGANLKNPIHTFKSLFTKLARNAKIHILATSPIYKNPPFGFCNQPFFYNATMMLATKMCLLEFYAFIFYLERIFGRTRKRAFKNAPRALDIDIIFFNDIFMRSAKLNIPHPRWRNRPSVVVPLLFQVNYKGF